MEVMLILTNQEQIMFAGPGNGGSKGTFNVDDVGYASASDVNMSVDALSKWKQVRGLEW